MNEPLTFTQVWELVTAHAAHGVLTHSDSIFVERTAGHVRWLAHHLPDHALLARWRVPGQADAEAFTALARETVDVIEWDTGASAAEVAELAEDIRTHAEMLLPALQAFNDADLRSAGCAGLIAHAAAMIAKLAERAAVLQIPPHLRERP